MKGWHTLAAGALITLLLPVSGCSPAASPAPPRLVAVAPASDLQPMSKRLRTLGLGFQVDGGRTGIPAMHHGEQIDVAMPAGTEAYAYILQITNPNGATAQVTLATPPYAELLAKDGKRYKPVLVRPGVVGATKPRPGWFPPGADSELFVVFAVPRGTSVKAVVWTPLAGQNRQLRFAAEPVPVPKAADLAGKTYKVERLPADATSVFAASVPERDTNDWVGFWNQDAMVKAERLVDDHFRGRTYEKRLVVGGFGWWVIGRSGADEVGACNGFDGMREVQPGAQLYGREDLLRFFHTQLDNPNG